MSLLHLRAAAAAVSRSHILRVPSLRTLLLRHSSGSASSSSSASSRGGLGDSAATAAISDSQSAGLHERLERARKQRRDRLWMIAFVMGSSAIVTLYRIVGQRREQERTLHTLRAQVASSTDTLQQVQAQQADRQAQVQKIVDAAVAAGASSTATGTATAAVPTSFLSAAVLDVQRTLALVAPDERVHLASTAAQAVPVAAAQPAAQKPRKAILM